MNNINTVLLYVASPAVSARFYAGLFGREPIEQSPTFAMFVLPSGLVLGLWIKEGVEPAPVTGGGGSEIGVKVEAAAAVDATYGEWRAKGVTMAMAPTALDFGRSFVALDPDGHRLRVYAVAEEA